MQKDLRLGIGKGALLMASKVPKATSTSLARMHVLVHLSSVCVCLSLSLSSVSLSLYMCVYLSLSLTLSLYISLCVCLSLCLSRVSMSMCALSLAHLYMSLFSNLWLLSLSLQIWGSLSLYIYSRTHQPLLLLQVFGFSAANGYLSACSVHRNIVLLGGPRACLGLQILEDKSFRGPATGVIWALRAQILEKAVRNLVFGASRPHTPKVENGASKRAKIADNPWRGHNVYAMIFVCWVLHYEEGLLHY